MFRAHGAVIANGNRLIADLGMSVALWQVLDALERADGACSVAEIARAMGLARQSVQRSVNLLTDRQLTLFTANPAHKRAQLVVLTPAGRDALNAMNARIADSIACTLDRIPGGEIAAARMTLTAFAEEQYRQMDQQAGRTSFARPPTPDFDRR